MVDRLWEALNLKNMFCVYKERVGERWGWGGGQGEGGGGGGAGKERRGQAGNFFKKNEDITQWIYADPKNSQVHIPEK